MKKLTFSIALSLIICAVLSVIGSAREVEDLTDMLIRIHVIANSDSEEDQNLKLAVRDGILSYVSELTEGCKTKTEAMESLCDGLGRIEDEARGIVAENGFGYEVNCTLSSEEFDRRTYDGFELPAGEYDSLCIRLGSAEGKNWWCVCYPSICLGSAMSVDECGVFSEGELIIIKEPEKVRYKLWCFEAIRKLRRLFAK